MQRKLVSNNLRPFSIVDNLGLGSELVFFFFAHFAPTVTVFVLVSPSSEKRFSPHLNENSILETEEVANRIRNLVFWCFNLPHETEN